MNKGDVCNLRRGLEGEPESLLGVGRGEAPGGGAGVIQRAFAVGVNLDSPVWEVRGDVIESCCKCKHLNLSRRMDLALGGGDYVWEVIIAFVPNEISGPSIEAVGDERAFSQYLNSDGKRRRVRPINGSTYRRPNLGKGITGEGSP